MFKRWMRSEPMHLPGCGWVPMAQLWEETPEGAVERIRLFGEACVATEREARARGVELTRRWLGRRNGTSTSQV